MQTRPDIPELPILPPPLLPIGKFIHRLTYNVAIGVAILVISLAVGILGYHHFEDMNWIDAYVNAAMILSGMGPVSTLQTDAGKIFAGTYALFSGVIFLVIMVIILAPVFQRLFHKFHLEAKK